MGGTQTRRRFAVSAAVSSASARRVLVAVMAAALGSGVVAASPAGAASVPTGAGSIAAGSGHVCALAAGGTVKCWGLDNAGQMGNGTSGPGKSVTKPVSVPGLSGVTALAAGDSHTCALLKAGTVKCWGLNDSGQLGDGTETTATKPVSVKGVQGGGLLTGVIAITAAGPHTCALLAAGAGTVKCWGLNSTGVLGNGVKTFQRATTPQSVAGLTRVVAISTSNADTCAVLKGGTVQCWGFSEYGELGPGVSGPDDCPFGDADFACSATPRTVSGISNVVAISERDHSSCAMVKNAKVICWGLNVGSKSFVTVSGISGARSIASAGDPDAVAGDNFSCVVLADNTARCWGFNSQGQLGNGTKTSSNTPTKVAGLAGVSTISAGGDFACARLVGGAARCWGASGYGQLGNGKAVSSTKPVPVLGL